MRLLAIVHFPVFGGPHNQLLRLDPYLRRVGVETTVLLPADRGNAADRLRSGGLEVVTMPLHRLRATSRVQDHAAFLLGILPEVAAIRRLIRDVGIDMVQIGGLVNPHGAIAGRLEGIPVVWQLLDTRTPRLVSDIAMLLVRALSDAVLSTGRKVALGHPGGGRLGERLVPFFPPVDTELFRPDPAVRDEVRREWGVPLDAAVVGMVANINPQKGVDDLVDVIARVAATHPRTRLVLVGEEHDTHVAYSERVRSRMRKNALQEGRDVIFLGARDDVHRQLQGFDVFALASQPRSEGIPTVILEAMACGLPVVATDVGGVNEVVEDGVTGALVAPRNQQAMAAAISRLLDDPDARRRIGREAIDRAATRYSVHVTAAAHVRAYDLAARRRPRHQ
jgi:glycosyltransferase involved in cell wall biosynthesis